MSDLREALTVADFDHASEVDMGRAKLLAKAAGWNRQGFHYINPTGRRYLARDMDGWIDLCDNEGIDWTEGSNHER